MQKNLNMMYNEQISEPGYRGVVTEASDLDDTLKIIESQKSEATKLREQYPGISEALLNKIVKDNNPQRKAEVLASLDEVLTMMDKGINYLMGL
jgi:predicted HAD superfamily phosphohydrolase YqeG